MALGVTHSFLCLCGQQVQTVSPASQKGTETVPELVVGLVWRMGVVGYRLCSVAD